MTSTQPDTGGFRHSQFGTLTVLGWTGEHPEDGEDMSFLLAYSLGDGEDGPEAGEAAARQLLEESGLPVGDEAPSPSRGRGSGVRLIVEAGQAVLTMPHVTAQYPAPQEWVQAAEKRQQVYFIFATRPWPEGAPGTTVTEEGLRSFVDDEAVLNSSAHCLLPVRPLQG